MDLVETEPKQGLPLSCISPSHSSMESVVTSSAPSTMTRRARPTCSQSAAIAMAEVVDAQATLTLVFGPRAPMNWANWLWPIARTWNRKRRSKFPSGSAPLPWMRSMRRL